jgi:hypothetical protein
VIILYPAVPVPLEVAGIAVLYGGGGCLGAWCYSLLRPLSVRGRLGRAVAQFWASWVGVAGGLFAAVWIAGPYVLAAFSTGRGGRGGGYSSPQPLTAHQVFVFATIVAIGFTFFGVFAPRKAIRP